MILLALILLIVTTVAFVASSGTPGKPIFQKPSSGCGCVALLLVFLILICLVALGPVGGQCHSVESGAMQTTRTLALAMFQYANDNNGHYPDGASSTEVFQKLIDGNYLTDPAVLFVALPGKVRAEEGARLKPENVAYDVTSGVDAQSPDGLPLVFLTGFRVSYLPGASAVSLVRPFPKHYNPPNAWFFRSLEPFDGLAVAYKGNNAWFRESQNITIIKAPSVVYPNGFRLITNVISATPQIDPQGYGVVPNVVSPDFDAGGRTYRQLTPDGVLK
jgi:hypothetical protein